tara:strand:- start:5447 stop:6787 length:1341 start_codon:yes stop_codon:yes gene_type:complete
MNILFIFILALLILPLLILAIRKMDDLFLLLISLVFLISWVADELLLVPHFFTWSIEFVIAILFINYLLPKIVFLKKVEITPIGKYALILLLYTIFGSFIYLINFSDFLLGFRAFFRYLFLFFIFVNSDFSKHAYKKFFKCWLFFMSIQPFIAFYQYFVEKKLGDPVFGTLNSTGLAAVLLIIFIICLIDLINRNKIPNYILYIFIFLSMTIIPIFGEAKAFFYFLPIILFIRYFDQIIKGQQLLNISKFLIVFASIIFLFQTFFGVQLFSISGMNINDFRFSQGVMSVLQNESQQTLAISLSERFLSLVALYDFLNQSFLNVLFGEGLGSNIFVYESRTNFLIETNQDYLKKFALSSFITNIGLVGFILFCFMLFKISLYAYQSSFLVEDLTLKSIYKTIPAFSVLFILSLFYTDPFEDVISFSYWFFVMSLMYSSKDKTITLDN